MVKNTFMYERLTLGILMIRQIRMLLITLTCFEYTLYLFFRRCHLTLPLMCHYQLFLCGCVQHDRSDGPVKLDAPPPLMDSGGGNPKKWGGTVWLDTSPPSARWFLEDGVPGVREHVGPLIPVDGVLGPFPDLDGCLHPPFKFVALRCDYPCVIPVHYVVVSFTVV